MKLSILLVVLAASLVFRANCRDHTVGPGNIVASAFDTHHSPGGLLNSDFPDTFNGDNQLEKDVNEEQQVELRGKKMKWNIYELLKNIKSMEHKLIQVNTELKMELRDIKNRQDNITDINAKLNMELISIKENNSKDSIKLDSIRASLTSIGVVITNHTAILESIKDCKSNKVTPTTTTPTTTSPTTTTTATTTTTTTTTVAPTTKPKDIYCPDKKVDAGQDLVCARRKGNNYQTGVNYCKSLGLNLAQPKNLLNVCSKVLATAGGTWYWIGGKGTGSYQRWNNGTYLSSSLPVWQAGYPKTSTSDCLVLYCSDSYIKTGKVLRTYPCSSTSGFDLCA